MVLEERIDQAVEVIRNRVDGLGVAEPEIQAEGDGILVSLPGVDDQQRALDLVGDTAVMRFRRCSLSSRSGPLTVPTDTPQNQHSMSSASPRWRKLTRTPSLSCPPIPTLASPGRYVLGPTGMTGEGLSDAQGLFTGQQWIISVDLKGGEIGDDAFQALTEQCFFGAPTCPRTAVGPGRIAVDLDNLVISAPAVQADDLGDSFQISGQFTQETADELALKLRFGALPIQLEPENQQVVSATIGQDALDAGVTAGLIGLVLVAHLHHQLLPSSRCCCHVELADLGLIAVVDHLLPWGGIRGSP